MMLFWLCLVMVLDATCHMPHAPLVRISGIVSLIRHLDTLTLYMHSVYNYTGIRYCVSHYTVPRHCYTE